MYKILKRLLVAAFISTGIFNAGAQKAPEKNWNSARILHELDKMRHVGRVLYIAAHPDDENTHLISYLVNVKGIQTAYMSLTRGDGGQNLIGPEVREELGVIRTQELLMARSVDGGQQFFSRANDFGFSKTAAETFHIWNRNEVLSDIVWVIRNFKPDIIITRFSPTYAKTHGHHQASAILAKEAFSAAADSTKFPEQLKYVGTWQAQSIFWNTSFWFYRGEKFDTAGLYHTNIGTYMPLLGKSVGEMAAESRSMHKTQGFGSSARRGDIEEYFVYMAGKKPAGRDILGGVNTDWSRIKGCENIPVLIENIINRFDMKNPAKSIGSLESLYNKLSAYKDNYLVAARLQQLQDIILQCAAIYTEATSNKEFLPVGDSVNVSLNVIGQNKTINVGVNASLVIDGNKIAAITGGGNLKPNEEKTFKTAAIVPENTHISGPYWLEEEPTVGMYRVDNQLLRGLPQNPQQVVMHVSYILSNSSVHSFTIERDIPVFYKTVDPVKGEEYAVARIVPPAVANPEDKLLLFTNSNTKQLTVKVKSFSKENARIKANILPGWKISPPYFDIDMPGGGNEQSVVFTVTPPANEQTAYVNFTIKIGKHNYTRSSEIISYDHIPTQLLLPESTVKLTRMDIVTHPKLIGYIEGAGDDMPQMIRELGYKVEMISPEQIATANLSKYDAIISGIRAYNTVNELKYNNYRLMNYVKNGGNYIVQYNKNFDLITDSIGPYMLHPSNTRTTEEDAKVVFINKDNPALTTPNKITEADFNGWVQERGLYYPDTWDTTHYTPLLAMADSGEKPAKGSLLIAKYGKGNFVYTGLAFFRQLPAGVPGAFRLFANLIELPANGK